MEPWRTKIAAGDVQAAWDLFIERYRRLILATIRRTVLDSDDAMEVFSEVCADLSIDDLALPLRHDEAGQSKFSTWLVTVVHHRTVDWMRQREGRRRISAPRGLSAIQQWIFQNVFVERRSHVESYELLRQRGFADISFGAFLREIAGTYRAIERTHGSVAAHFFPGPPLVTDEVDFGAEDAIFAAETGSRLAAALEILPADERLAVKLFVIDELPAERVARIVGWPNPKAVYNRVYRSLASLRRELQRLGVDPR